METAFVQPPSMENLQSWMKLNLTMPEKVKLKDSLGIQNEMVIPLIREANIPLMSFMDMVEKIICREFNVEQKTFKEAGKSRKRQYVQIKQLFYFMLKKYRNISLATLGQKYLQDHATVLYGIKSAKNLRETDRDMRAQICRIEQEIESQANIK